MARSTATTLSEFLRQYRQRAGLTQEELAERAGLSTDAVGALERGVHRRAHPHTLRSLATALGLSEGERKAFFAAVPRTGPAIATPAAAPPAAASCVLPLSPTPIIGREREEAVIVRLLERPEVRLVTVTGPGGVGKTRLALQVAASLRARFDGACFVDLAALRDPGLVPTAIAQTLGVRERGSRAVLAGLLAAVAEQNLLLVLDNFEHLILAAPVAASLLAAGPRVKLLVTSRMALRVRGEHLFPLAPLAVPENETASATELLGYPAVHLFVDRAQAVDPAFTLGEANAETVAAICTQLDGLPLAIELAAARAGTLPPAMILTRLTNRLGLLTAGAPDAPARQRTLRDAIAWSYDLLPAAEQALFRRLSVFAGGFTLEAAETVGGRGGDASLPPFALPSVLDVILSLAGKSLLQRKANGDADTVRFDLLETVREYGREQLAASGEETATRDAHAAYFLALVERAEPELVGAAQREWLDRLQADHPNLRAALDWLTERRDVATALRLAAACSWLWWYRGHFAEGRARLEALLAQPGAANSARAWAAAMSGLGMLTHGQGDTAQAAWLHEAAVTAWRRLDDPDRLAEALFLQGLALVFAGDDQANLVLAECVAISRTLPNPQWLGGGLGALGMALHRQGDLAGAAETLEGSLARARELDNPMGIAVALWALGDVAWDQGDEAQALALLRQAMPRLWHLGETWSTILCLERLATTFTWCTPLVAARLFAAAAAWREAVGLPQPQAEADRYERAVAAVRDALGEENFAAAWTAGQSLTPEEAIAEATVDAD